MCRTHGKLGHLKPPGDIPGVLTFLGYYFWLTNLLWMGCHYNYRTLGLFSTLRLGIKHCVLQMSEVFWFLAEVGVLSIK